MKKLKGISLGWTLNLTLAVVFFASLVGVIADQFLLARCAFGNCSVATNITGAPFVLLGLGVLFIVLIFMRRLAGK